MKKPFKKTKIGKLLNSKAVKVVKDIALGIFAPSLKVGTGVVAGAAYGLREALKNEKTANLTSENGGMNKPNYYRIFGYVIFAALTALFVFGKIDKETFEFLFDFLKLVIDNGQ